MRSDKPSLLARLKRLFRHNDLSSLKSRLAAPAKDRSSAEEEGASFPLSPAREEIQVVEVDSVEFVQEWGRTVANRVEAQDHAEGIPLHGFIDRRLPNFDRRNPSHNRRVGDGHDRRRSK